MHRSLDLDQRDLSAVVLIVLVVGCAADGFAPACLLAPAIGGTGPKGLTSGTGRRN